MLRSLIVATLAGIASLSAIPAQAQGSWQPTEPVEFVVPYGPGGGADVFTRILAQAMADDNLVPVPVQVVNRPGGGSAVGVAYVVARRAANPHTLVLVNNPTQTTPIVVADAAGLKDLHPIYNFMLDDFLVVIRADSPWTTAGELVEAARAAPPRTIVMGSPPSGGEFMAQRAFATAADVEFNEITYSSSSEVLTALLGGHLDVMVTNPGQIRHLGEDTLRVLGTLRTERFPDLPDVPALRELGFEFETPSIWRGVAVPQNIPAEAVAYWEDVMEKLSASPTVQKYLEDSMATPVSMKGDELIEFLNAQEELYRVLLAEEQP